MSGSGDTGGCCGAVIWFRAYGEPYPQIWRIALFVDNVAYAQTYTSMQAKAVVDDFGTLVAVGGFA